MARIGAAVFFVVLFLIVCAGMEHGAAQDAAKCCATITIPCDPNIKANNDHCNSLCVPNCSKGGICKSWTKSGVPPELESKAITPLNKSHLYISKNSPSSVLNAYSQQFEKDFSLFLRTRSKEVVPGGRMILSFMGRRATDICSEENCYLQWELLAQALRDMVSEGVVKEEKLESFNVPYYSPCPEEVETEVQKEGSFTVDRLQILDVEWDGGGDNYNGFNSEEEHNKRSCRRVTETIRAVVESMLSSHFGVDIMDDLFCRFNQIVNHVFPKKRLTYANLVISMTRKA